MKILNEIRRINYFIILIFNIMNIQKILCFFVLFLFLFIDIQGQNIKEISGRVVDKNNVAIIGATVVNKSQPGSGTTTDFDGKFTIDCNSNDMLVISYIGFISKEMKASLLNNTTVTLEEDIAALDEVVVVGYGTQKKTTMTGSVSVLSTKDIINVPSTNVSQSLAGRIPGVTARQWSGRPGADAADFRIRGGESALVVIDGIIGRDLSWIDPNDIESLTVLKDASATAVYGARGQNGVILITTKRGGDSKPKITYNTYYAVQTPTIKPDFMSPKEKYVAITDYYNSMYGVNFFDQDFYNYMETDPDGVTRPDKRRSGAVNYYDTLIRKFTPQQNHSLSISGGTDRVKYFIAGNFTSKDGIWTSDVTNYNRYTLRSNVDTYLLNNKDLRLSADISFGMSNTVSTWGDALESGGSGFWDVIYGNGISEQNLLQFSDGRYFDQGGYDSPAALISEEQGYRSLRQGDVTTKLEAEYSPSFLKGLSLKFLYSFDYRSQHTKNWKNNQPHYSSFDQTIPRITASEDNPTKEERADYNSFENIEVHLKYAKKIDNHDFSFLGVFSQNKSDGQWLSASRKAFPNADLEELKNGGPGTDLVDGTRWESRRMGYVFRANYGYADKYLLELSCRYDGSYNFAPGRRWGFFPAMSLGWRVSEEQFFKDLISENIISNLKIRGSVGQSGSDNISSQFSFLGTYYFGSNYTFGETAQNVSTAFESRIPSYPTWQTTTTYNAGIDLGMFNNRLNITFDTFYARTVDILQQRDKTYTLLGASLPQENIGRTRRGGYDLGISYNDRISDFTYSVGLNVSYWDTVVEFIDEAEGTLLVPQWRKTYRTGSESHLTYLNNGFYQTYEDVMNNPRIEEWNSILPGDLMYKDLNGDGVINDQDKTYNSYGNNPQLNMGFNFSLGYKGFYLSGLIDYTSKYNVYLTGNARANAYIQDKELIFNFRDYSDVWTPDNTDAKYPRIPSTLNQSYSTNVDSDFWLADGTTLRLRSLELGYDFSSLLKNIGISNLKIYLSGTNLLTFNKIDGFDSETANFSGSNYPLMKVFSIGANLQF